MFVAQTWRWRATILTRATIVCVVALAALAFQGSDTASAAFNCSGTGSPLGPYTFETWEAGDYKTRYGGVMDLAGTNQLFPQLPGFALPALETGDRSAGSSTSVPAYVPSVLLKAIAYIESGWAQGAYDPLVDYGQTGPTLVSADCGYGLMQVTSGMQNVSGMPSLDQAMIGGHYAYNIARGAQILAFKWNEAPEFRPVMGGRDPHVLENWYYALWAYNGFAYKNHPLNPGYDPNRPPYDCRGPRSYPYQELVLGCVANPPLRAGLPLWEAQPVALPNLSDPAYSGPLDVNNWNACSFELQCAPMDIPTPEGAHTITAMPTANYGAVVGAPSLSTSSAVIDVTANNGVGQTSITYYNAGTGLGSWRARSDSPWLSVSRVQGISQGSDIGIYTTHLILDVHLETSANGQYTANVTVDAPGGVLIKVPIRANVQHGCDDTLTLEDVLAVLNAESGVGGCVGDVQDMNCDGKIDAADIVDVMRFLSGLPPLNSC